MEETTTEIPLGITGILPDNSIKIGTADREENNIILLPGLMDTRETVVRGVQTTTETVGVKIQYIKREAIMLPFLYLGSFVRWFNL
jgi:hypothetical protein